MKYIIGVIIGSILLAIAIVIVIAKSNTYKTKDGERLVFVTEGGKTFHVSPKCRAVKGRQMKAVRISAAVKSGLKPCGHCIRK